MRPSSDMKSYRCRMPKTWPYHAALRTGSPTVRWTSPRPVMAGIPRVCQAGCTGLPNTAAGVRAWSGAVGTDVRRAHVARQLVEGDEPVTVLVHHLDGLGRGLVGELHPDGGHELLELGGRDAAVAVLVHHGKGPCVLLGVDHRRSPSQAWCGAQ